MNSIDIDVIRTALDWLGRGHRVVLGTVVRTWGSAPRPPGSLMIIRDDGQVAGSVSGGCIEDDLIAFLHGIQLLHIFLCLRKRCFCGQSGKPRATKRNPRRNGDDKEDGDQSKNEPADKFLT